MNTLKTTALLALIVTACMAAPQNNEVVNKKETKEVQVEVVGTRTKGPMEKLEQMQNDDGYVRVCRNGSCVLEYVYEAKAKAQSYGDIESVSQVKAEDKDMAEALANQAAAFLDTSKGVDKQKELLDNLKLQMEALTRSLDSSSKAATRTDNMYAEIMSKGVNFAAAPPPTSKGAMFAPPSKGNMMALAPPTKGRSSAASTMQLEAAMCPMTMYELGKAQKLSAEMKTQLDSANSMNAYLSSQKNALESQLAVCEVSKAKEAEQAAFNAKYAAEQKNRADMLERALALANAEKSSLERQKATLESTLATTQAALASEKQTTAMLTSALQDCNQEKAQLEAEKAALIDELKETQDVLRQTQRDLEDEQVAHARTQRELDDTKEELELSEDARRQLEEAKQQLEDELAETKSQLEVMTAERDTLQTSLDATSAMLATCNEEKMTCKVNLAQEKAISEQLNQQLEDAMTLLAAEKAAREELSETIAMVKAASEKVQEEVQRLQLENVQLQQQIAKLRSEQEAAAALSAGCPPTYEKFGLSCYKYVREKTQWKMAQEQCMKDGGNLVAVESRQEQAFLVDYLKRHGASDSDSYSLTSGNKQGYHWKWLGSNERHIGATGPEYWFNELTKNKPNYNCQAMYLREDSVYGKWVGLPCYSSAPFTCEYLLAPAGTAAPANSAETLAMFEMYQEAPPYLAMGSYGSKGSYQFAPPYGMKGR